jgi:TRAP-type C4-dicarboxylate transport system permease small subunit
MKSKNNFDRIVNFLAFLAGMLVVAIVLIVVYEIFMRYFLHRPSMWMVEVCEYMLFAIAFLGAPWLLREGGHVSVDVVTDHIGPRSRGLLRLVSMAAGVFACATICWFSLMAAWQCYQAGAVVMKTLFVPKHYFLVFIAFGYFVLFLEFARQIVLAFRNSNGNDQPQKKGIG